MVKLNSRHLMFLIVGLCTVSMKTYPTVFSLYGKRDTWIATIIASALILAFIVFSLRAGKRIGDYALHRVFRRAFGNRVGNAMTLIFLLTALCTVFESTAVESNVLHVNFMRDTPVWIFLAVSSAAAMYVVKRGGASVVSTTIIGMILVSLSGILLGILTQKYKEVKYLFPIFENGINLGFIGCVLRLLGAYGCFSLIFPYLDGIEDKRRLTRHCVLAMLFVIQIEVVAIIGVLTTFGLERMEQLLYPKITQTQIVSYFGFMEAGELFVMLQIVSGWFIKFIIALYALVEMLRQIGFKSVVIGYAGAAAAFVASCFIADNLYWYFRMLDILTIIQLIGFVLIPGAAFAVCMLRLRIRKAAQPAKGQSPPAAKAEPAS